MAKVYLVEFMAKIDLKKEGINVEAIPEITDEQLEELQESPQYITGKFHVLAYEIGEAYLEASEYLTESEITEFEITKLSEETQIQIVNYEKTCDCVFCRAETCSPDERMDFKCNHCGENIAVADGWTTIQCPNDECGCEIKRESIHLGSDGKYFIKDSKN